MTWIIELSSSFIPGGTRVPSGILDYYMSTDFLGLITKYLKNPEQWVTFQGGWLFAIAATTLCGPGILWATTLPAWLDVLVVLLLFVLLFISWWLVRECYWRSGRDMKVAISFEGHRVPFDDLAATRREIASLAHSRDLKHRLSIRLFPPSMTKTTDDRSILKNKYHVSGVLLLTESPRTDNPSQTHTSITLDGAFRKEVSRDFMDATKDHLARIMGSVGNSQSVDQLLRRRAEGIFEAILLILGLVSLTSVESDDASVFLYLLEKRLAQRFKEDEHPRLAVRWLDHLACLRASNYLGSNPPGEEGLIDAVQGCHVAIGRYGTQFPGAQAQLSRNLFFQSKLEEALDVIDGVIECNLKPKDKVVLVLNRAVLCLFLARWESSACDLSTLFAMPESGDLNWKELVGFADCAMEMGHSPAIFIQALYRRILGELDSKDPLHAEVIAWLDSDRSRRKLKHIYEHECKQITSKTNPQRRKRCTKTNRRGRSGSKRKRKKRR
jgi:hypothetical protein